METTTIRRNARRGFLLALALAVAFGLAGCAAVGRVAGVSPGALPPVEGDAIEAADYADANNWLEKTANPVKPTDVFVLYPTTYVMPEGGSAVASIGDARMRAGARDFLANEASAIAALGNVFAPYYRQVDAMWTLTRPRAQSIAHQRGVPKTDALAAFDYYLKHLNGGRPFTLVGHSQGSAMTKEILFDYFVRHPEAARRMVAAYVIGFSVTPEDLRRNPAMKFARGANDVGVIVSYNTVAPGATLDKIAVVSRGALAINPITWTRGADPAPASLSLGSQLALSGPLEKAMNFADATLDAEYGVVICRSADEATYAMPESLSAAFGKGSFHLYDFGFYYYNLRENAARRIERFLAGAKD
jgi:hypothetical protein